MVYYLTRMNKARIRILFLQIATQLLFRRIVKQKHRWRRIRHVCPSQIQRLFLLLLIINIRLLIPVPALSNVSITKTSCCRCHIHHNTRHHSRRRCHETNPCRYNHRYHKAQHRTNLSKHLNLNCWKIRTSPGKWRFIPFSRILFLRWKFKGHVPLRFHNYL